VSSVSGGFLIRERVLSSSRRHGHLQNANDIFPVHAVRFGVPVCPHAGGVGLCEYVIHLR
jgi:hypothetical protein